MSSVDKLGVDCPRCGVPLNGRECQNCTYRENQTFRDCDACGQATLEENLTRETRWVDMVRKTFHYCEGCR